MIRSEILIDWEKRTWTVRSVPPKSDRALLDHQGTQSAKWHAVLRPSLQTLSLRFLYRPRVDYKTSQNIWAYRKEEDFCQAAYELLRDKILASLPLSIKRVDHSKLFQYEAHCIQTSRRSRLPIKATSSRSPNNQNRFLEH